MSGLATWWERLQRRYTYRIPMAIGCTLALILGLGVWAITSEEDGELVATDSGTPYEDPGVAAGEDEGPGGAGTEALGDDGVPGTDAGDGTAATPGRQTRRSGGQTTGGGNTQTPGTASQPAAQPGAAACPQGVDRGICTGVTDTAIRVGSHAATSQCGTPLPDTSDENEAEASDWVEYINKIQGGVHGRKLELYETDDGYCPEMAGQAARQLMDEYRVFSAQGFLGVDQNKTVADYAQKRGVPYLAGGGPREWASRWSVFHQNQSGYDVMYTAVLRFIVSPHGLNKPNATIGMMYVETADVKDPTFRSFANVPEANVKVKLPLQGIKQNFANEISQMKAAGVDTVYCNCHPLNTVAFVSQADAAGYRPQYTFVSQGHDLDLVLRLFPPDSTWRRNAKGLSNFCHPSHGCAAPYREKLKQVKPNVVLSQVSLVGIHAIEMWAEPMRRVGRDLNRTRYMQQLQGLNGWTTGLTGGIQLSPDRARGTVEFAVYESPAANAREYRIRDVGGRAFNRW